MIVVDDIAVVVNSPVVIVVDCSGVVVEVLITSNIIYLAARKIEFSGSIEERHFGQEVEASFQRQMLLDKRERHAWLVNTYPPRVLYGKGAPGVQVT